MPRSGRDPGPDLPVGHDVAHFEARILLRRIHEHNLVVAPRLETFGHEPVVPHLPFEKCTVVFDVGVVMRRWIAVIRPAVIEHLANRNLLAYSCDAGEPIAAGFGHFQIVAYRTHVIAVEVCEQSVIDPRGRPMLVGAADIAGEPLARRP